MNINSYIQDDSILVVPNTIKDKILLSLNDKLFNIKIMSLDDLIKRITFMYDKDAIYFLMKKYNVKYEISLMYLNNIKYIEDTFYNEKKLDKLVQIKKELIDNNLIKHDDIFLNFKNIIVYGYDYINKYNLNILNKLNATIIKKKYNNYVHKIYEFDDIEEEIEYIANNIIDLINDGIDINNIKLCNINKEYYNPLKRIFKFYNIPINITNTSSIYDTPFIKSFITLIKEKDINEVLNILKKEYKNADYLYNKLIDILNDYTFIDNYKDVLDMLIYDFKHTKNNIKKYDNAIEIIDLENNIIDDNLYIFMLSFNNEIIPNTYKDEDYITDNIKNNILLETTLERNKIQRNNLINIIKSIKNLTITYKLKTPFNNYLISNLIDDLPYDIEKVNIENKYSNKINYFHLAKSLDDLIKYNKKTNDLDLLYNNYSDINYLKYNNKFKGINKNDFRDYIDNKLLLSYSSIDNYYRCSFRYYLSNILKLDKNEETFAINIGNIFHEILSKCFDNGFDFEKEWNDSLNNIDFKISDKFFLKKLKEELIFIIDTIKFQNKFSSIDNSLYENKIYINKEGNVKLTFMGIIDKLLYKTEGNNTYLVIIDYKTGNVNIDLNNVIYGIDMQLPVYLYLAKEKFENAKVIGFYLQKILDNEIIKENGKTYEKQKKERLKLKGYSINNEEVLSKFDFSYKDSEIIKSMKISKNGFYSYSKVIDEKQIESLINIVKNNIDNAFNNILECKFDINPTRVGKELIGCKYCKYKDICYMKEEDIKDKKEYKNMEFLGGDNV